MCVYSILDINVRFKTSLYLSGSHRSLVFPPQNKKGVIASYKLAILTFQVIKSKVQDIKVISQYFSENCDFTSQNSENKNLNCEM